VGWGDYNFHRRDVERQAYFYRGSQGDATWEHRLDNCDFSSFSKAKGWRSDGARLPAHSHLGEARRQVADRSRARVRAAAGMTQHEARQ